MMTRNGRKPATTGSRTEKMDFDSTAIFQRVQTAYAMEVVARTRAIVIGTGGAAGFVEDLARSGIQDLVLVDHDVVTAPNIATQQAYLDTIGMPKVACLAERLGRINPAVRVSAYQKRLEEISDTEFYDIAFLPVNSEPPVVTLLLGMTDNFYTQARVNRLSLQFGIPSLCAQMYAEGLCGEITLMYPGITAACHRCMLKPRYQAYLQENYHNTVTSHGSPIWSTTRINALAGSLAMALLHHGTDHQRWGNMLSRIGNRTLVQIRMHPDAPLKIFPRVFDDLDHCFFDEAVWLPQEPDPDCPECHGTGNLLDAKGTFTDTRDY